MLTVSSATNMDLSATATQPPFPQHWTYADFFAGRTNGVGAAEGHIENGAEINMQDEGDSDRESDELSEPPADLTSTGIEGAAGSEHDDVSSEVLQEFPLIPAPKVDGLRFSSHDAAATYLLEHGKKEGYNMVRPSSSTKKNGIAIRQRWLCDKGMPRNHMNQRKARMLERGIPQVRNRGSKKTGCTFACTLHAVDQKNPTASQWVIELGRNPVHNHPRNETKQLLREKEIRQARLTAKKEPSTRIIHDAHQPGQPSWSTGQDSIWERVRIMECKADELDYMRQPVCSDWLFHTGNVSFARDRASFKEDYQPIDNGFAILEDGNRTVSVLGIGTVFVPYLPPSSGPLPEGAMHSCVLHIPAARCNGISIPRWESNGYAFKAVSNHRVIVYDKTSKATLFTANDSSEQVRLCMDGEFDEQAQLPHLLKDVEIKITADRAMLAQWALQTL